VGLGALKYCRGGAGNAANAGVLRVRAVNQIGCRPYSSPEASAAKCWDIRPRLALTLDLGYGHCRAGVLPGGPLCGQMPPPAPVITEFVPASLERRLESIAEELAEKYPRV
jgi:hypothetical protein